MLSRHDWVTPVLYGHPWLEKPPLYYWCAMLAYKGAGVVSDSAARLPSAILSSLMVFFIYAWARRFRRGMQLDAALITAAAAMVIGFGRSASTDMPLTAMFTAAMLCWYGWYSTEDRGWLLGFYLFIGLGTLAKGPDSCSSCGVDYCGIRRSEARWTAVAAHALAVRHRALSRRHLAMVHSGAASQSRVLPRLLSAAEPGALYHRPLPSSSAVLVLPAGRAAGAGAVDRVRDRSRGGRRSRLAVFPRAAAGNGRPAHLSDTVAAAAGPVFLAVAIEAAGIHSAVGPGRSNSAGRLHPATRRGAGKTGLVAGAACTRCFRQPCWPPR